MPSPAQYRHLSRVLRMELKAAADQAGLTPHDLLRRTQQAHVVAARLRVFRFLRRRGFSYPAIGAIFGLHHSTVLLALQRHPEPPREPAPFPDYSGEWAI
jgi:hypothetical protein